jgi:hypothetical protein
MHVLGFAHTPDFTSVMYAGWVTNGSGTFSAGDITGLKTMYLDRPCTLDSTSVPESFQTCVKRAKEPESCTPGLTWSYSYCWSGSPGGAVLQQAINRSWKTILRGIATKDSCKPNYPWTLEFERTETDAGTKRYRVNIPARGGYGSTTDALTVTVTRSPA